MNNEYNLLTQHLLAKGYTAENHPDFVTIDRYYNKADPLDNFDGGFVFKRSWVYERTFKTPCGIQCKGISCHTGSMSYMGIEWTFENDMAIINCPYDKAVCGLKHEYLQGNANMRFWCNVHMVDEEYQYERSVEQALKLHEDEIRKKRIIFEQEKNGRVCFNHMFFDRDLQEWKMRFNLDQCVMSKCIGYCPILGRPLDSKKGNVYYDIKRTYRRYDLDGTLFEGQVDTEIIKGNRVFDSPMSMDICRNYVKLCKDRLIWMVNMKHHAELYFAEYHGRVFKLEVLNIRAEQKESRDLMQDLQDIREGIRIVHESDLKNENKANKRERRKQAQEKKIQKLEKKLIEVGYENLEEYSLDRIHADKWLTEDRIAELEEMRKQKIREEQEKPVQLNLFDLEG